MKVFDILRGKKELHASFIVLGGLNSWSMLLPRDDHPYQELVRRRITNHGVPAGFEENRPDTQRRRILTRGLQSDVLDGTAAGHHPPYLLKLWRPVRLWPRRWRLFLGGLGSSCRLGMNLLVGYLFLLLSGGIRS